MTEPFVAEIRLFPFNFAPTGWATCDGQLMPITQNTALFSLVGTFYGGDGKSTFALPDLGRNAPMHWGNGAGQGLSNRFIGEQGGSEFVTLLTSEIPAHTHNVAATSINANTDQPSAGILARGNYTFQGASGTVPMYFEGAPDTAMSPFAMALTGGSLPHNNMQPYLKLNFCIALQGVFPPRN